MQIRLISLFMILCLAGCTAVQPAATSSADTSQSEAASQLLAPSAPRSSDQTLIVFAAASLSGAFQEIGKEFSAANPGVQVSFNFAGSQILRTQLEQGARADVFASADHNNIGLLIAHQLVDEKSVRDFAANSLIVILPPGNPGSILTLMDLARPKLKLVLADSSVPAGNYARQVLEKMSQDAVYGAEFSAKVLANVASNETDVKQVVAKVELGEADAGIVYASDAVAAADLSTLTIPPTFNVIAKYPIAISSTAPEPELAAAFIAYVTSPAGKAILTRWGFKTVDPS